MKSQVRRCFYLVALLAIGGCGSSTEPVPVTTDEDKIAEYEAMIAGEEASAQEDARKEVAP